MILRGVSRESATRSSSATEPLSVSRTCPRERDEEFFGSLLTASLNFQAGRSSRVSVGWGEIFTVFPETGELRAVGSRTCAEFSLLDPGFLAGLRGAACDADDADAGL